MLAHLWIPRGPDRRQGVRLERQGEHDQAPQLYPRGGRTSVGLYTSPDLNGLRERVRVGTRPIPNRAVCEVVERLDPYLVDRAAGGDAPTVFEVLTGLSLWQFGREGVDVVVREVGIGDRYDAASVVDPTAAAVTSISPDHTDTIGSTVGEIAADKATVAPVDRPLVTEATGSALSTIRGRTDVVTVGAGAPDGGRSATTGGRAERHTGRDVHAVELELATRTESTIELGGRTGPSRPSHDCSASTRPSTPASPPRLQDRSPTPLRTRLPQAL